MRLRLAVTGIAGHPAAYTPPPSNVHRLCGQQPEMTSPSSRITTSLSTLWLWALAAALAGGMVIAWVWWPVLGHVWVSVPTPSTASIERARSAPTGAALGAVARQSPLGPKLPEQQQAVVTARRWLADPRLLQSASAPLPLHAADLFRSEGTEGLAFASLAHVDVFVHAFNATQEVAFLNAARDHFLSLARYEKAAWRDRGFLWNDHAIASRVGVALRLWQAYRNHPSFDEAVAREMLEHVARCVALLADPNHFTAWSNHGVMQNLALLQAAAAFPTIVDAPVVQREAMRRLALQWDFYLSREGVVLEHSAAYHAEGTLLLSSALELALAAGLPVPADWAQPLDRAKAFLADITRPDGTLPPFGDTRLQSGRSTALANTAAPAPLAATPLTLYPVSGYAVMRQNAAAGSTSHVVVNWSNFPAQAHKHADELGLTLWAAGRGWITPTGYAPYGSPQRWPTERWLGSNAPHNVAEGATGSRTARLVGSAGNNHCALLDVERVGAEGGFRRQVVDLAAKRWIVIDWPLGPGVSAGWEAMWTWEPDLVVRQSGPNQYIASDGAGQPMTIAFASTSLPPVTTVRYGSLEPFGGWSATEDGVKRTQALHLAAQRGAPVATLLDQSGHVVALTARLDAADRWTLAGPGWSLTRNGDTVSGSGEAQPCRLLAQPAADVASERQQIHEALQLATATYPKYRNVDSYRDRMALLLAAALGIQLLVSASVIRWARRFATLLHGPVLLAWLALWGWLSFVYFT